MTPADAIVAIAIGLAAGSALRALRRRRRHRDDARDGRRCCRSPRSRRSRRRCRSSSRRRSPGRRPTRRPGRSTAARPCGWRRPGCWARRSGRSPPSGSTPPLLLLVTAALLGWQSVGIIRGPRRAAIDPTTGEPARSDPASSPRSAWWPASSPGSSGVGGGLVMVPLLSGWCRMPLKRALGTSLLTIPAIVIPGTIVHAAARQHRLVGRAVPHDRRGARGSDRREAGPRLRRADAAAHGRDRHARGRRPLRGPTGVGARALTSLRWAPSTCPLRCGP